MFLMANTEVFSPVFVMVKTHYKVALDSCVLVGLHTQFTIDI